MNWGLIADVAAGIFLVLGAFLSLVAAIGTLRFPDLLARMHAAAKPQVLGLIFILLGLELRLRSGAVLLVLILVVLFQFLTAPVSAHMVGRAGYRTGKIRRDLLVVDDLSADIDAAGLLEARDALKQIAAEMTLDGRAVDAEADRDAEAPSRPVTPESE